MSTSLLAYIGRAWSDFICTYRGRHIVDNPAWLNSITTVIVKHEPKLYRSLLPPLIATMLFLIGPTESAARLILQPSVAAKVGYNAADAFLEEARDVRTHQGCASAAHPGSTRLG